MKSENKLIFALAIFATSFGGGSAKRGSSLKNFRACVAAGSNSRRNAPATAVRRLVFIYPSPLRMIAMDDRAAGAVSEYLVKAQPDRDPFTAKRGVGAEKCVVANVEPQAESHRGFQVLEIP